MSLPPNYEAGTAARPQTKTETAALQSATMTAKQIAGANVVLFTNTGTTPGNLQLPPAADVLQFLGNRVNGQAYTLKIRNGSGSANTATITTNTGWTLSGAMTIAQNETREFIVEFTGRTAKLTSVGKYQAAA